MRNFNLCALSSAPIAAAPLSTFVLCCYDGRPNDVSSSSMSPVAVLLVKQKTTLSIPLHTKCFPAGGTGARPEIAPSYFTHTRLST